MSNFRFLLALLVLATPALAEEKASTEKKVATEKIEQVSTEEQEKAFLLVTLKDVNSVKKVRAYISFSPELSFEPIQGIFLEQSSKDEATGTVWGVSLPGSRPAPTMLILIVEAFEEDQFFYIFGDQEFSYFPSQTLDEVRARIALQREEVDSARVEKEKLEAALGRLEADAKVIGGFEQLGQLERRKTFEEGELRRVTSQLEQLKKSIEALKRWKVPADLPERKRVLIKDIQELQKK